MPHRSAPRPAPSTPGHQGRRRRAGRPRCRHRAASLCWAAARGLGGEGNHVGCGYRLPAGHRAGRPVPCPRGVAGRGDARRARPHRRARRQGQRLLPCRCRRRDGGGAGSGGALGQGRAPGPDRRRAARRQGHPARPRHADALRFAHHQRCSGRRRYLDHPRLPPPRRGCCWARPPIPSSPSAPPPTARSPASPPIRGTRASTPAARPAGGAAAVAAGMGNTSLATDAGGSTRIPAALCGKVGFKATNHRVPAYPPPGMPSLSCPGAITHTVTDTALMMNVMTEPDPRDWLAAKPDGADYLAGLDDGIQGLRVAYSATLNGHAKFVDPEVAAAVAACGRGVRGARRHRGGGRSRHRQPDPNPQRLPDLAHHPPRRRHERGPARGAGTVDQRHRQARPRT